MIADVSTDAAEAAPSDPLNDALDVFMAVRPRLFGIAYRMLGSASEAEDIVQEAWVRWQRYDRDSVENPAAFLATTTTRLAINSATSAHARRESYIGPWLPEPVDTSADPALGAEKGEALEFAILMLMERLTPMERAAYVLRQAFDYPYETIGGILEQSQANVRQHVSRARKHLAGERRERVDADEQRRLLAAFLAAAQAGEMTALEELFAGEVVSTTDGNGVKNAARKLVAGREWVAKFIAAFAHHFWVDTEQEWVEANGEPAILVRRDGEPLVLVSLSTGPDGIEQIRWMMAPAKLERIAQAG
ncbi:sigma-70 family RNA polymerase sigma factor [Ruania sp. N2-46]|uniref:Sigma-70 family RNA polymerase sigma factor n=1 Tax=Occultella gossypii TaxID=2800820 RepID=A0ABS7S6W3_9MICO|nr:sigma-70 family RNA polymerase sigma factor [Occultella gossypii]